MGNTWTAARYEKKYLLTKEQYVAFKEKIKYITEKDKHGDTTICNIYYDTQDFKLIRASLEKPVYKEKFRIRSYGMANDDTKIFAEIKKKYDGIVYKRRVGFKHKEMLNSTMFELKAKSSNVDKQILDEINYLFKHYDGLVPKMFICYDREPMFATDESGIRITFDKNILYRTDNLRLDTKITGTPIMEEGMCILELKTGPSLPVWIAEILTELKIYPASFSKYGVAYKKYMEELKNGNNNNGSNSNFVA